MNDPFYEIHFLRRQLDTAIELLDGDGEIVPCLVNVQMSVERMDLALSELFREVDANLARLLRIFAYGDSPSYAYNMVVHNPTGWLPHTDEAWNQLRMKDRIL